MVFFQEDGTPEPVDLADGVISDSVLDASKGSATTWLPVHGDLVDVLVDLAQRPGMSLVRAEEMAGGVSSPCYLARAAHQGSYFLGVCSFHFAGARINVGKHELVALKYDVLVGRTEDFMWKPVQVASGLESLGQSLPTS
ncbi:hypothetical protein NMY22_g19883 [Coprinellus aureogranulatus]|nr:hypothetical protein NMY22_g19883 [Coprinellus aureogranulatus]